MKKPLRLLALLLPALAATARADQPLNADTASSTIFVVGYHLWFSGIGSYSFQDSSFFNPSDNNGKWAPLETQVLQNGQDPALAVDPNNSSDNFEWGRIFATPSLAYPSTGSPTYSATPGPGFSPGYYSNNDSVLNYHAQLIANLGVQAVMPDFTNLVYSLFAQHVDYSQVDGASGSSPPTMQQSYARMLQDLDSLAGGGGPSLHVIPAVGAFDSHGDLNSTGSDGFTPFQHALQFFIDSFKAHPNRAVTYGGNPLITVFNGGPADPGLIATSDQQVAALQAYTDGNGNHPYANFTVRHLGGWDEISTSDWTSSPRSLHPPYTQVTDGLWSWRDRLYADSTDAFAGFALVPGSGSSVEFSSVPVTSYGSSPSDSSEIAPFLPLRRGEQINWFMSEARALHPRFVLVNQFNQWINDGAGFTVDGMLNMEPTIDGNGTVHSDAYDDMKAAIASYRTYEQGQGTARFTDIALRGQVGSGQNALLFDFILAGGSGSGAAPVRTVIKGMGPSLAAFFPPGSVTTAANPTFSLTGTSSLTGEAFAAANSSYVNPAAATVNGSAAVSSLDAKAFKNSAYYVNYLNYGQTMSSNEPAITADLDPATYTLTIGDQNDPNFSGQSPGPMVHARLVPGDEISPNRVVNFSGRGYVSSGNNVIVLGFTVDGTKGMQIQALGPSLANYGLSGVLQQPQVVLYNSSSQAIQSWTGESAVSVTLGPGSYSVILSNQNSGGSGDGIGLLSVTEN